jgi:SAM-dependent methyltransferase
MSAAEPVCTSGRCRARGYTVIGVDVSADQLRVVASRNRRLVRADAGHLPLRDASVAAVAMTFLHTDVDHFLTTIGEAARVLSPGGRLVYLGARVDPELPGDLGDRPAGLPDDPHRRLPELGRELPAVSGTAPPYRPCLHDLGGTSVPLSAWVGGCAAGGGALLGVRR